MANALDERDLQIFRLSVKVSLFETEFLKLWLRYRKEADASGVQATHAELLRELEQHARMADKVYLSDATLRSLHESQRAFAADEYREVVEEMKAFISGLKDG